jgi:hypothetical protein
VPNTIGCLWTKWRPDSKTLADAKGIFYLGRPPTHPSGASVQSRNTSVGRYPPDGWASPAAPWINRQRFPRRDESFPAIGIVHGEIFYLKDLVEDCADDGV